MNRVSQILEAKDLRKVISEGWYDDINKDLDEHDMNYFFQSVKESMQMASGSLTSLSMKLMREYHKAVDKGGLGKSDVATIDKMIKDLNRARNEFDSCKKRVTSMAAKYGWEA